MISLFSQSPGFYVRPSCNCPHVSANFTFPEREREGGNLAAIELHPQTFIFLLMSF